MATKSYSLKYQTLKPACEIKLEMETLMEEMFIYSSSGKRIPNNVLCTLAFISMAKGTILNKVIRLGWLKTF
jgi:hypothetical protein